MSTSSATYLMTAVNGAFSGTFILKEAGKGLRLVIRTAILEGWEMGSLVQ